jgi:hypothetical protein
MKTSLQLRASLLSLLLFLSLLGVWHLSTLSGAAVSTTGSMTAEHAGSDGIDRLGTPV